MGQTILAIAVAMMLANAAFAQAAPPPRTPPSLVKRDTTAPDRAKLPYLLPTKPPAPTGDDGSTAGKSNTE